MPVYIKAVALIGLQREDVRFLATYQPYDLLKGIYSIRRANAHGCSRCDGRIILQTRLPADDGRTPA